MKLSEALELVRCGDVDVVIRNKDLSITHVGSDNGFVRPYAEYRKECEKLKEFVAVHDNDYHLETISAKNGSGETDNGIVVLVIMENEGE